MQREKVRFSQYLKFGKISDYLIAYLILNI